MKCPRCGADLKEIVYEGVLIDNCPNCGGNWLDKGEITTIIKKREVTFSQEEIEQVKQEKNKIFEVKQPSQPLICPKCSNEMQQLNYAYSTGVIIDRCSNCGGIWLDKGELEKIQIIMEDEEDRLPQLRQKLEPILENIKEEYAEKIAQSVDETSRKGLMGKIPGVRHLVKFLLLHF